VSPERKRAAVRHLQAAGMCSERRACALVGLSRSSLSYKPRVRADESALRADIRELAQKKRRYGYRRIWWELRQLVGLLTTSGCIGSGAWRDFACLGNARDGAGGVLWAL